MSHLPPAANGAGISAFIDEASGPDQGGAALIDGDRIAKFSDRALHPDHAEPYTMGGRTFRRQFLTMEGDRLLAEFFKSRVVQVADLAHAVALVLQEQAPECGEAWLVSQKVTSEEMAAVLEGQGALVLETRAVSAMFDARRALWSARSAHGKSAPVTIPPDTAEVTMLEWAARTYGGHPDTVRTTYSNALLLVLLDAHWWGTCAMPPDSGADPSGDAFPLGG
jgi:hypothetical protein